MPVHSLQARQENTRTHFIQMLGKNVQRGWQM